MSTTFTAAWRRLGARGPVARRALALVAHAVLTLAGYAAAFAVHDAFRLSDAALRALLDTAPLLILARLVALHRLRQDRAYWRHVGVRDVLQLSAAITLASLAFPVMLFALDDLGSVPATVLALEWLLAHALLAAVRLAARVAHEYTFGAAGQSKRTLIVGAGAAGEQLLRQILHDSRQALHVVGLVDDDRDKLGRVLHGVPVLGDTSQLRGLVALHHVQFVLLAIPSAGGEALRQLVDRCVDAGVEFKLLPPLQDQVTGQVELRHAREVRIDDLLGRPPVRLDVGPAAAEVAGRVVLITGAGGSIGSELARQVVRFNPLRVVLLERAESPLYFTHLEVAAANPAVEVVPVLASVTNVDRLRQVFARYRPDLVLHAAAYKHVPMLEANAVEGVWNNVVGTLRVARCAAEAGTDKFVLISTDKAVQPSCVLGATKRVAERIVRELPALRASHTDFRVVRFGNVLGSDGSVVPLFQRQLAAGGPLTVTHPEVRRYFMTIAEAVELVLKATALPEAAGRIALLQMGTQVRILDLAEQMIRLAGLVPHRDVPIVFTGMRPGEKLEEELLARGEIAGPTSDDKIQVVRGNGLHGDTLARQLRHLIAVTERRDEGGMRRALAALVPDYEPGPAAAPAPRPLALANGNGHRPPGATVTLAVPSPAPALMLQVRHA